MSCPLLLLFPRSFLASHHRCAAFFVFFVFSLVSLVSPHRDSHCSLFVAMLSSPLAGVASPPAQHGHKYRHLYPPISFFHLSEDPQQLAAGQRTRTHSAADVERASHGAEADGSRRCCLLCVQAMTPTLPWCGRCCTEHSRRCTCSQPACTQRNSTQLSEEQQRRNSSNRNNSALR